MVISASTFQNEQNFMQRSVWHYSITEFFTYIQSKIMGMQPKKVTTILPAVTQAERDLKPVEEMSVEERKTCYLAKQLYDLENITLVEKTKQLKVLEATGVDQNDPDLLDLKGLIYSFRALAIRTRKKCGIDEYGNFTGIPPKALIPSF